MDRPVSSPEGLFSSAHAVDPPARRRSQPSGTGRRGGRARRGAPETTRGRLPLRDRRERPARRSAHRHRGHGAPGARGDRTGAGTGLPAGAPRAELASRRARGPEPPAPARTKRSDLPARGRRRPIARAPRPPPRGAPAPAVRAAGPHRRPVRLARREHAVRGARPGDVGPGGRRRSDGGGVRGAARRRQRRDGARPRTTPRRAPRRSANHHRSISTPPRASPSRSAPSSAPTASTRAPCAASTS